MSSANAPIKTAIIESALPLVPFEGWTMKCLEDAAQTAGYSKAMATAVFPRGVADALVWFSGWADERMLLELEKSGAVPARVRDKIAFAVETRLSVLAPFKEAERLAIAYWMGPFRKLEGARLAWKTADAIWRWAGDTSTDYNHYTKRGLLCGVLGSVMLCWLGDESEDMNVTKAFLDRRIDNVMTIGKIAGRRRSA